MIDKTRVHDIEQLHRDRLKARNGFERDLADRTLNRIMRESGMVREKREKLIMAVRNNDTRAINRFQHELLMMRANDTYGKDY